MTPTDQQIRAFRDDGVVLLQGVFTPWVGALLDGVQRNLQNPSVRGRTWDKDDQGRACYYDSQVWLDTPEYKDFIFNSPASTPFCRKALRISRTWAGPAS